MENNNIKQNQNYEQDNIEYKTKNKTIENL